jgi:GMP reductase
MNISNDTKLDFDDVLIVPQRTTIESRKQVNISRTLNFYHSPRYWEGVPVICANMSSVATEKMANALSQNRMITCLHKYYGIDDIDRMVYNNCAMYVWPSIGKNYEDIKKLKSGRQWGLYNICVDVANGYVQSFVKFCQDVRNEFPEAIIMAGNVATPEMTQELIINGGVDIVKTQIGPGRACLTRMVTGVGYGTLSCVDECSHAAHGLSNMDKATGKRLGWICSDGGCKNTGDICKALGAGADFVMLGSMFSKAEEAEDKFYGMSTHYAQEKHGNEKKQYRASEGTVVDVSKNKVPVNDIVQEIQGAIRSCCTYIGADSIKHMPKCTKFAKVNKIHSNFNDKRSFGV